MAMMDKPEDTPLDVDPSSVSSLDETGDVEQENIEYSPLVQYILSKYERSKTNRLADETRWLTAYRNYRGIYGSEVQFTDKEKSQAFVKITKTKVLASYAQIVDVLFAGAKFPIGLEARKYPNNVAGEINFDPKGDPEQDVSEISTDMAIRMGVYAEKLEKIKESVKEGSGDSPTSEIFEPAKKAAQNLEQKIHDQLSETEASKHLRSVAFEMSLFGTGILKGPFAFDKEYPRWNEEGKYDPLFETIPKVESVSIWNFYPDPAARNISDCEFTIERHRLSRTQLRNLNNRPFFRKESIELAIEYGESYNPHYWEDVLEDTTETADLNRFEVLEFWGMMDSETAEEAGLELPEGAEDQVQINAWICNGQIIRLVLNPFTPKRIPYQATPYELNPYSFFGIGVAENMSDTQLLMNGFMRLAVDNAALSSNLLIEIDETNLVPGQNLDVYPGKVFRRQSGAPGQALFGTKFPNVTNECLQMFDKARQLSDESTGMPSYAHGIGGVMGVGRTASGMSMLMGAAAQNIKAVVRNIDDYLLSPLGRALFSFNMQFNFDPEFLGDLEVKARGTESLMRNEVRSQRLLQFMQMSANPQMAPFVKYDYILREIAASMDLDEDKLLNDKREAMIQAKLMAEMQQMMPQQGQGGQPPIPPEQAPEPNTQGFTGEGGGANSPPQPQPQQAPQQPPQGDIMQ
tara:strand:- start:418 stop:2484 length:2067 start_codon:yes stop_codon:yes gene_type:complete